MNRNKWFANAAKYRFLVVLLLFSITIDAQKQEKTDTLQTENLIIEKEKIEIKNKTHNPRLATLMSVMVPGLGQAYNKKYWKISFIYGGGLALYYNYNKYNDLYLRVKQAREELRNEKPISDPDLAKYDLETLKHNQSILIRNRDWCKIGLGLLYFANVIDAMVDGHLYSYDVSDDLSLFVDPAIITPNYQSLVASSSAGITIGFKF